MIISIGRNDVSSCINKKPLHFLEVAFFVINFSFYYNKEKEQNEKSKE